MKHQEQDLNTLRTFTRGYLDGKVLPNPEMRTRAVNAESSKNSRDTAGVHSALAFSILSEKNMTLFSLL